MKTQSTRPATALQAGTTTCHHTRESFDAQFRCIAERRDISSDAKLVYGYLVSQRRLLARGKPAAQTQAAIGEKVGLSRHQVWRAIGQLVFYGLVTVRRPGQGLPNEYELHGVDGAELDGKSSPATASRPGRNPDARQAGADSHVLKRKEENRRRTGYTPIPQHGSAYLETRRGTLSRR